MATYRLLTAHCIDGSILPPLTTLTRDADFVPTLHMEPLDDEAIRAYWKAGPQTTMPPERLAARPVIYWRSVGPSSYALTGKGAALGAMNI